MGGKIDDFMAATWPILKNSQVFNFPERIIQCSGNFKSNKPENFSLFSEYAVLF